jgi:hypothetical protein
MVEGNGEIRFVLTSKYFNNNGTKYWKWLKYNSHILVTSWAFVETEDWRKDLGCEWSGYGGDQGQCSFFHRFEIHSIFCKLMIYVFEIDGWVYNNDAWLGPRPVPYTSGGGSVTRRRRWIRRVWFDMRWPTSKYFSSSPGGTWFPG